MTGSAENQSREERVQALRLNDDGVFPNNPWFPALLYRGALDLMDRNPVGSAERILRLNGWGGTWRNGVHARHHYHSRAHEVLIVCAGLARLQLGGAAGPVVEVRLGDVLIIPAGVAHRNVGSSGDFRVVGAYPPGQNPDMCTGEAGERPAADKRVARMGCPATDPAFGASGPLARIWGGGDPSVELTERKERGQA